MSETDLTESPGLENQAGAEFDGNGGSGDPFGQLLDGLPEDLRSDSSLASIKNFDGLIKSYIHAQRMVGADKLALPGKGAPESDWDAVYEKLGRPADPSRYVMRRNEAADGGTADPEVETAFRHAAHRLGLSQKQFEGLYDWYEGLTGETEQRLGEEETERREQALAALRHDFGKAFDRKVEAARRAVRSFADAEAWGALEEGLGNDPRLVRMFARIGERMAEDHLEEGRGGGFLKTPAEAREEIARLQGETDFMAAYRENVHSGHRVAVERMQQLFEMAYPESEE
jgi:hypothetical protein